MYPLRLLACLVFVAALGFAAESPAEKREAAKERAVEVTGMVSSPGTILFPPQRGLTITEAISMAGGQTRRAELRAVELTRREADGTPKVRIINVAAIINTRGTENVALQPGDVISVPPRN